MSKICNMLKMSNLFLFFSMMTLLYLDHSILMSWNIVSLKSCNLDFLFLLDWMSLTFFFTLCVMVSCVLKFSSLYMAEEKFFMRFHYIVLSFVFSMFCLIFMPHFFFLLIGWDGLGITSFLLVIYYLSSSSWAAGMKTYLINRLGDGLFLVALSLLLIQGHWDMKGINNNMVYWLFMVTLVLGCFTKSAQFPFSSWLPAAMAAPTPVSSLVHSSTLVTAGVYLLMRFSYMMPKWCFTMIGLLGLWTLYSASLAACFEWDAKKIVAYSTLSQLGFMVVAISMGLENYAFFHLITHAMFKAMMFMCVGYFMVNNSHFQDLRSLSGMWKCSPIISICLIISALSLMGFPFMSGFFSKELVMESNLFCMNEVFFHLLLFSLPLTSYYIGRLTFQLFNGKGYGTLNRFSDSKIVLMSLLPLFMGSIMIGKMGSSFFYSMSSIYPCSLFKLFMNLLILSGVLLSFYHSRYKKNTFSWFFSEMSFIAPFKGNYWVEVGSNVGEDMNHLFDQGKISSAISDMDKNMLSSGTSLSNLYNFFKNPSVGIYMILLMLMIFSNWFLM